VEREKYLHLIILGMSFWVEKILLMLKNERDVGILSVYAFANGFNIYRINNR